MEKLQRNPKMTAHNTNGVRQPFVCVWVGGCVRVCVCHVVLHQLAWLAVNVIIPYKSCMTEAEYQNDETKKEWESA